MQISAEKHGGGVPILRFDEWVDIKECMTVIIASRFHYKEIYEQLRKYQVPDELIINVGKMVDEANRVQYFDLPELKKNMTDEEVFVDAGVYDGLTSSMFAQWAGKYKKIIALEPDPKNRERCQRTLASIGAEYEILPYGAWDKSEQLFFASGLNGSSHINSNGEKSAEGQIMIQADKLDNLIQEKVTYIKMDIEGAEINAIKGAEKIIKKYKPKLAICVYHKKEDIWAIPKLILSYVPNYKLYLRHYSLNDNETVLYCVVE